MALRSMTGFARAEAQHGELSIQVEARCVNGRSSDIKLRLPSGFDHLDKPIRAAFQAVIRRGNANISVSLQREATRKPRINKDVLNALHDAVGEQAQAWGEPAPPIGELLALPGVIELVDPASIDATADGAKARDEAITACAQTCADDLANMRAAEGSAMQNVLATLVDDVERETQALAEHPDARGEQFMKRLQGQLTQLIEGGGQLEPQRLHQEAALLASKADIEEELARLRAHCQAARALLTSDQPAGRKLDFLAQEFNREANTICSKAGSIAITQHGLALKALIDQVKEQVQNVE